MSASGRTRSASATNAATKRRSAAAAAPAPRRGTQISPRLRQIYEEASKLFVERGVGATSMADIAEAVGLTKAGLYHFIQDKDSLLFDLIQFGMDELFEEVVEPARMIKDPHDRLRLIVRNHIMNIGKMDAPRGNPVTIVVEESAGLSPLKRRKIEKRKLEYFQLVRGTISEMAKQGMIAKDLDPTIAAHSLIGMIMWTSRWRRPGGRLRVDEIVTQITSMAFGGLLTREA